MTLTARTLLCHTCQWCSSSISTIINSHRYLRPAHGVGEITHLHTQFSFLTSHTQTKLQLKNYREITYLTLCPDNCLNSYQPVNYNYTCSYFLNSLQVLYNINPSHSQYSVCLSLYEGQGFQNLQQYRQTDTQTDATKTLPSMWQECKSTSWLIPAV